MSHKVGDLILGSYYIGTVIKITGVGSYQIYHIEWCGEAQVPYLRTEFEYDEIQKYKDRLNEYLRAQSG